MNKLITTIIATIVALNLFAQTPNNFKYQTVVRDAAGYVMANHNVSFQISIIQGDASGIPVYIETFDGITTNEFGLVNLSIGDGITGDDFSTIDWSDGPYFIKTELDPDGGTSYSEMGTSQLLAVPYAMYAQNVANKDDADADPNNEYQTVSKMGSTVTLSDGGGTFIDEVNDGDYSSTNELQILNFSNDTLYLDNGGQVFLGNYNSLWNQNDTNIYYNNGWVGVGTSTPSGMMVVQGDDGVNPDSAIFEVKNKNGQTVFAVYDGGVRIWVDDTGLKANTDKGGFAVGGYRTNKSLTNEYLRVTPDSVRVYIREDDGTKANTDKGGFAVGGYRTDKAYTGQYFQIDPNDTASTLNPSEARIFWYPLKEAFLSGRVLVEHPDSVGTNSWASGFESKSIGDYSQALGYRARAKGNNSTAIGYYANATGNDSYALGNAAKSKGISSYAIGTEAEASGDYSFAIGSPGEDYTGASIGATKASGDYSYAFGMGALASNKSAFAFGTQAIASGSNSVAIGYITEATGSVSTAIGFQSSASGEGSVSIGRYTHARGKNSLALLHSSSANGENAVAIGLFAKSMGTYSTAIGKSTYAKSYNEFVTGMYNDSTFSTNKTAWVSTDPLFIIGNGTTWDARHNAVTVLKNGNIGFNTNNPTHTLTINSSASPNDSLALRLIGPKSVGYGAMLNFGDGNYVYLHEFADDRLRIQATKLFIPGSYNDAVGATNKALYIDDSGLIGYLSSSKRYKKEINPMENTDWFYKLRPVNYIYKTDNKGIKQYGLIAEEVEKINRLFVSYSKEGQIETVNYNMFISPMIKVIQEQKLDITKLQQENNIHKKTIEELEKQNNDIIKRLESLENRFER